MIQFYQKRDFGTLISDTFTFFKENGKNFFKNYFLINGLLLIFLVVMMVVFYRGMMEQVFKGNVEGQSYYYQQYFQENTGMLVLAGLVFLVIFLACMLVTYSYPVLYMKRLAETGDKNITTDQILGDIKKNIKKFLLFFLGMMFVMLPLTLLIVGLSSFLMVIIIGFFLLILLIPALVNVVNFTFFDYYHTNRGFFSSLSYAFRAQFSYPNGREKSPFWKYWGSTLVTYMIINIITGVITMIPMIIVMIAVFTMQNPEAPDDISGPNKMFEGTMGLVVFVIYGVSIFLSMIMMNFMYVNSGLMYYDSRTDLHRNVDISEIDTIGTNEA